MKKKKNNFRGRCFHSVCNRHVSMLLFLCLLLTAVSQATAKENPFRKKDLKVIKTVWFDIIYPPDSAQSANLLAANADKIYENITGTLNRKPWFRMPVVITPARDEFNAYFSTAPYNHIVVYDTPATEIMAVYNNQLLSTFLHELTHAVTYNMKNKFWRNADAILGDYYNPGLLTLTTAVSESSTVSFESRDGSGRLNDGYSMQMVRQAKIEKVFPGWADIQGAKSVYPITRESYIFGGAFASWLQETYGMEKYALYWEQMVNLKSLTYFTAFKQVYDIPIESAWNNFRDSITVPDIPGNPLEEKGYGDLFTVMGTGTGPQDIPAAASFSKYNTGGELYDSLTGSSKGFCWTDLYTGDVWYASKPAGISGYGKPQKLFSMHGISRLSLAADGRYLAVSFTSESGTDPQNKISIYDILRKQWFHIRETGLRDATVISSGGKLYMAAVKTHSQYADIKIYRLEEESEGTGINSATEEETIYHHFGDIPFSLTDGGNGTLVYLYKTGLTWSIRRYDMTAGTLTEYTPGTDRIALRNISLAASGKNGADFLFSFSRPDTLPRLGILHIETDNTFFRLQKDDVSGGIHYPVSFGKNISDTSSSTVAYIGEFYQDFKLLYTDISETAFDHIPVYQTDTSVSTERDTVFQPDTLINTGSGTFSDKNAVPYNAFDYYRKGYLWPFTFRSMLVKSGRIEESSSLPVGLTYVTSDPWDGSLLAAAAAYDIFSSSCIGAFQKSGGTSTELFKYLIVGQMEFDGDGYKQSYGEFRIDSSVPTGRISTITVSDTVELFEGRQNKRNMSIWDADGLSGASGLYKNPDDTAYLFAGNKLAFEWSNIHSAGPGIVSRSGISITPSFKTNYYTELDDSFDADAIYKNLSLDGELWIPGLLPVLSVYPDQYNIPASLTASLFPSSDYFLDSGITLYIYAHQIQKAVSFIPMLYAQSFLVMASYSGQFSYGTADSWDFLDTPELTKDLMHGDMDYYDTVSLTAAVLFSPNISRFTSPLLQLPLFVSLLYRIRPENNDSHWAMSISGFIPF